MDHLISGFTERESTQQQVILARAPAELISLSSIDCETNH